MVSVPPSLTLSAVGPTSLLRAPDGELEPTDEQADSANAASRAAPNITGGFDMGASESQRESDQRMLYTRGLGRRFPRIPPDGAARPGSAGEAGGGPAGERHRPARPV